MSTKNIQKKRRRKALLEELEPRILFSAGLEGLPLDIATLDENALIQPYNEISSSIKTQENQTSIADIRTELIILDASTPNYQQLIDEITGQQEQNRYFDIVILDSEQDGIAQISEILSSRRDIDTLHLISHGNDGQINLGNTLLQFDSLLKNAGEIAAWGDAFSSDGDFLIYGCNLAATDAGQSMVNALSRLTQTDLAASDDLTGHAQLGGDWVLEYQVGNIDKQQIIDLGNDSQWLGTLDITTGLQGHWTLDTDGTDSSGNNYNGNLALGAVINNYTGGSAIGSGSITLDGVDSSLDISAHASNFDNFSEGTIAAWVRTSANPVIDGGDQIIFSLADISSSNVNSWIALENGQLEWHVQNNAIELIDIESTRFINDGNWHHVAVTVDSGGTSLYVDGVEQTGGDIAYFTGSAASTTFFDDIANLDDMRIGINLRDNGLTDWGAFDGSIDDVRVYNRGLSAADITELYNAGAPNDIIITSTNNGGLSINEDGGNDAYLLADDSSAIIGGASQFTVEVSLATTDSIQQIISYASSNGTLEGTNQFRLWLTTGNNAALDINGESVIASSFDYSVLTDGNQHTISATWDNAAGDWQIYVDGVLADSGTGLQSGHTIQTGGALVFGQEQDGVNDFFVPSLAFSGTFYDIRIFDDIRTGTEIADNYDTTVSNTESGLVANWIFDNVSTNGVIADTVNGNNLTINHANRAGFTPSNPSLTLSANESFFTGAVVGSITATDAQRDSLISTLLASNPNLTYSAETGMFYESVAAPVTWDAANTAANSATLNGVNGRLVNINSAQENDIIFNIANNLGAWVWLGGSDLGTEGEFQWNEGTADAQTFWTGGLGGSSTDGAYVNWAAGDPNDDLIHDGTGEHYVVLSAVDGTWFDWPQTFFTAYVIEYDADAVLDGALDTVQPLTYTITGQTISGAFTIDNDTGEITVADINLLDFETNNSHNITVRATDIDGNFYEETLAIALIDNDEAPVNNVVAIQNTNEDIPITFNAANSNLISITDDAGEIVEVTLSVDNGTLSLSQTTNLTFRLGDGSNDASMIFHGNIADVNAALDGLVYTPTQHYFGSDSLTISTNGGNDYASLNSDVNLQGFYEFETGNANNDSGPNAGPSGTLNGDATIINDATRGDVLNLDGTNDFFEINSTFSTPSSITLSAWVNLTSADLSGAQVITLGDNVFLRADSNSGGFGVLAGISVGSGSWDLLSTGQNIAGTGWRLLSYTYDDTTQVGTIYLNGVVIGSTNHGSSIVWDLGSITRIGAHTSNALFDFNGQIDDVRIYDRALSAEEISTLFIQSANSDRDSIAINISAVNDLPTGAVTIDNTTPSQGDTLTASNTLADADGLSGTINYQWQRNGSDIGGATGNTYITTQADVGATITVVASYTDDLGTNESVISAATAAVLNVNDLPTGAVTIDNTTPSQGDTLTASNTLADADGLSGTINYQWQRNGSDIGGATGNTYITTQADVGATITVVASYTDDLGTNESVSSAATAAVANVNDLPTGAVTIDNTTPSQGDTLTASNTLADADGLSGSINYQWQRNGSDIGGATGNTYITTQADVGATITVVASYTDDLGTNESVSSAATAAVLNVNDLPTGAVTIDNTTPSQGDTLTASNTLADADGLSGTINYQWQRNGSDIGGATGNTYITTQADVGATITVVASYTDDLGTNESVSSAATAAVLNVNDLPTGAVTIDNTTPSQGDTLTASNTLADADGLSGAISYQWQRNGSDIGGATDNTYITTQADVGATITVVASYTDDLGTNESVSSAATAAVLNVNDLPTGAVTIDNTTPSQGDTLTASNTLADADGLSGTINYQWQRNGSDIGGATGNTYITTQADVGATITVVASYTDDLGTNESVSSAATAAVLNVNDLPTGAVTIDNTTPSQGDTLTASNTLADADGLSGSINYQWQRNGSDIGGATDNTYITTQADVGATITVVASYTDDLGTNESVSSAATAAVLNVNDLPTGAVTIDNTTPSQGDTLTASNTLADADGLSGTINYQWQRNGSDIGGATGNTYITTQADVGATITVVASYTDDLGTNESVSSAATAAVLNVNDLPTGTVTIDNTTPSQGDTLTASNTLADADGLSGAINYQWQRNGSDIGGATGNTYITTQADVGATITVVASYTDDLGTNESVSSAATAAVANVNDLPTGAVTIDNTTPSQGDTLTASNTLADADGLSGAISYQWQRNGSDIGGATGNTYIATQSDVGTNISVIASYTDDLGTNESVSSTPTAAVIDVNDAPVANNDSVTVDEGASVTFNILANDTDIDNALDISSVAIISGPSNGTLIYNGDGTATYTHDGSETINDAFIYQVSDVAAAASNFAMVSINITPQNDAPIALDDNVIINEDSLAIIATSNILSNDSDAEGDSLSITIDSQPSNGTITFDGTGNYQYTPDANFNGIDSFTYTIDDGNGGSNTATVTIDVQAVNDSPVINNQQYTVAATASNGGNIGNINASDVDSGDTLSFSIIDGNLSNVFAIDPNSGQLTVNDSNALQQNAGGQFDLTVAATDSSGAISLATITINIDNIANDGSNNNDTSNNDNSSNSNDPMNDLNQMTDSGTGGMSPGGDNSEDSESPLDQSPTPRANQAGASSRPDSNNDEATSVVAESDPGAPDNNVEANFGDQPDFSNDAPPAESFVIDQSDTVEVAAVLESAAPEKVNNPIVLKIPDAVFNKISVLPEEVVYPTEEFVIKVAQGTTLSLSAGVLIWALRGGSLLASLMSTVPLWHGFDPLPILAAGSRDKRKNKNIEKDEIDLLFDNSNEIKVG